VQRNFHSSLITAGLLIACSALAHGADEARASLQRGITALHSFEYEDAGDAFGEARRLDAGLVMAYWGEAMTYHQTLWRNENVEAGREALARLGPTAAARLARTSDPKEQGYLTAIESLFGQGDATRRRRRYADDMGRLYGRYPDDPDVASFYALALLGTMSRSLIGTADAHEGHSEALAGSETQTLVANILNGVLRTHPEHPGALHYLLHNNDDPRHAHAALDAARTLARLAPDSSHTRHMPAHIFLQLGQWHDAATSDRSAFDASDAWIARRHLGPAMRNYHALAWLQYELLQLGRYRDAWATLDQLAPIVKASGDLRLLSDLSTMRARYVIETANWTLLASESNFGNANELYAIGVSAARSGNAVLAERARNALGSSRWAPGAATSRSLCFAAPPKPRHSFRHRSDCRRRFNPHRNCLARCSSKSDARLRRSPASSPSSSVTPTDRARSLASRARPQQLDKRKRHAGATASCWRISTAPTPTCPRSAKLARPSRRHRTPPNGHRRV
jgi:hypothetical protein